MSEIHFPALDLNLLRVFDALAEEANVTRAGVRLGLTQSAVSHALRRLRHLLDDELFVRGPDGMLPTARAQELAPRVRQGLHHLQVALTTGNFDPAQTRRRFTVAAGPYICATLFPVAAALIRREAPGVELRLRQLGPGIGDDLQTGRVDLAVGGFGSPGPRFEKQVLFHETTVWAMRAGHPAAQSGALTLETLARLTHITVATEEDSRVVDGRVTDGGLERRVILDDGGALDEAMGRRNGPRPVRMTTHDTLSALAIASQTDMAAHAPRRLASAFAEHYGLTLFEPPYPTRRTPIEALWRRDLSESAPIAWLRGILAAAALGI